MFTVIVNSSGLSLLFTCGTDDRHGMVVPMCLCFCAEKYWLAPRLPHPRFLPCTCSLQLQQANSRPCADTAIPR